MVLMCSIALALPALANGSESLLSGGSEYWDEIQEGDTVAPAVSEGTLKRRYDDLEEYDEADGLDTTRRVSVSPGAFIIILATPIMC